MGLRVGGKEGECPVTESVSDRLVRLPFYNDLTEEDLARVVMAIKSFRLTARKLSKPKLSPASATAKNAS
jgi:hypothetical protein